MMDYNIRLGDKLEIPIGEQKCVSMVQEITPEGTLLISMPTSRSVTIPLHAGELVQVIYYRPHGMFTFVGGVLRAFRQDHLELAEIELRSAISKYQRRDFVRMQTALTIKTTVLAPAPTADLTPEQTLRALYDKTDKHHPPDSEVTEGVTMDISGGGMRFVSPKSFEPKTVLDCTLWLKNGDSFRTDASVIRCDALDKPGIEGRKYTICIQFVNINEMNRRRLIKYIFDEQVKERRKEQGD